MTDSSLSQARADAEAGRMWHAIEGLRRVLKRDPADADAVALLNILLNDVFVRGSEAYEGGRLGLAAWCFTLLAEHGAPPEPLCANRAVLIGMLLRRATDDANASRISNAKHACRLVLALDPVAAQALLVAGQIERKGGDETTAATSIERGLRLAPAAEQAGHLRDIALQAGIRSLVDRLVQGRPAGSLLGTLDRLCPSDQAAALARCRAMTMQAEGWAGDRKPEALRQAASAALHWLGTLYQDRQRYREAFEAHAQSFDLWNSSAGLARKARAQQYLVIEELLETLKGYAYAFVYDMTDQASRAAFDSLSATMERLLEAPSIDHWTRTQRWTTLIGLRALVGYASVLGRNPLLPAPSPPLDASPAAKPSVTGQPARRRIFDCFTFFNEAEILEIRLAELYDVVDCFVVVEAAQTFAGEPKALSFGDHAARFQPYMAKIRYVVVDELVGTFSWQREAYQRDCILRGLEDCRDDDVIIISDVDEILRPEVVERLGSGVAARDDIYIAELDMFYYRLNYRFSRNWRAALAAPFSVVRQLGPNTTRSLAKQDVGHVIPDAGWHFSWIGDLERFAAKLNAYSHREHAQSFDENNMANIASFLEGGSAIPQGAPGARDGYEVVPLDRHPKLVRARLPQFRTMGWVR